MLNTAEWHDPHTLHVTLRYGGPPDPKYDKTFAQLPKTVTGVAQDVYVHEETAAITVNCLPSSVMALYHVPGSVAHISVAKPRTGMWKQLGRQAKLWSALTDWEQKDSDRRYNSRRRMWKVMLKQRVVFTPSQHLSIVQEQA